ncbi:leucyl/phenylalanyl-tRNA--protein transferase [Parafrankia colletiae]|uniref:Leucyl/phenylalanyl-tRNA--protein transferase n=1 Tax=Parafrankia colletiae TaxID=573497 RepID=A0A1S1QB21_9ACTN|nr:leucyl/phenylalanyl-tRNA--protein transferase [Parafrankia colletiae]MCK9899680.1 leucyl/phenylalanyl-tRNA--protein transferase [Frankia sp. Cpl3]OHV30661.1 leucyl/phenylalanyl-tRNA--protein transferase [Parafrankia colletiae]
MLTPPAPRPVRSGWDHPLLARYLDQAPPDGPVAAGGGMAPATLVGAYRQGAFPWPTDDPEASEELRAALGVAIARGMIPRIPAPVPAPPPVAPRPPGVCDGPRTGDGGEAGADLLDPPWWCPDPRTVLAPGEMRIRRSLVIRMRNSSWTSTVNQCFVDVVRHCRREGPHQWITDELVEGYAELHALGWAHSIEIWDDDRLVGGMYGVLIGRIFTGESMFHRASDGSKVALVDFLDRFGRAGGVLLDAQLTTSHLMSLGAREVPRAEFLATLRAVRDDEVRLECGRLPVSRLAPPRKPPPARLRHTRPPSG